MTRDQGARCSTCNAMWTGFVHDSDGWQEKDDFLEEQSRGEREITVLGKGDSVVDPGKARKNPEKTTSITSPSAGQEI